MSTAHKDTVTYVMIRLNQHSQVVVFIHVKYNQSKSLQCGKKNTFCTESEYQTIMKEPFF